VRHIERIQLAYHSTGNITLPHCAMTRLTVMAHISRTYGSTALTPILTDVVLYFFTPTYWKLKEEALDRTQWRTRFVRGYGAVIRQTTEWMRMYQMLTLCNRELRKETDYMSFKRVIITCVIYGRKTCLPTSKNKYWYRVFENKFPAKKI
jgi:hypothetical protein